MTNSDISLSFSPIRTLNGLAQADVVAKAHGWGLKVDPLDREQYERLKGGFRRYRDLLICKCLRGTGLRIAELMRLQPEQIVRDGADVAILIKRGKTFPPVWETQFLPPQLAMELQDYVRGNHCLPGEQIFKVTTRQVQRSFAEAGRAAIGRDVHPHEMRHLYIKTLLEAGLPVEVAAKMVGHKDPRTTFRVYYNLTAQQRAEITKRMPM